MFFGRIFFLKESSWKALSERLEIKNFKNSPFLTLADTLRCSEFCEGISLFAIRTYYLSCGRYVAGSLPFLPPHIRDDGELMDEMKEE